MARPELPTGTVTFFFSDIEGSTRLLGELGSDRYAHVLTDHRRVIREAFAGHGGVEVDTQGDAFFAAFPTAEGAVGAAAEIQRALADGPIKVRIGIHTGAPLLSDEGYVGPDVHRAARIANAAHGGQVLVSSSTAALTQRGGLRDLGEQRLKDLSASERIYQLGGGDFPRLKTLYSTNLPIPATPFVGRERELSEIGDLLNRASVRLLTLTGPGGTGKTRLAQQGAANATDLFADGVFWVPLAELRDPPLVVDSIVKAVGAKNGLAEYIADKHLLLLLDNFEQVLEAADDLARLLSSCPNLNLLITSRALLQLPAEHVYPVPPLAPSEGVELFVGRAGAVSPDFEPTSDVAELCRRLDNLPLAIELAAARVRVLTVAQLLKRLGQRLDVIKAGRGVDPRQQTLRATMEWSYDLLSEDERQLFARLAVFRGGWTLEEAEEVCGADIDVLASLVDKSLVRKRDERFTMLETIREFAAEKLQDATDGDAIRRRHGEFFLALAEEAAPHLLRGDPTQWLVLLSAEHDNLRTALDYFSEAEESELEQRLAGSLWRFWQRRGHFVEGRVRLERALRADERPTKARAWVLFGAAVLFGDKRDDAATGRLLLEQALSVFEELGDAHAAARVRMNLGVIAILEGDLTRAETLCEEAVRVFDELGDEDYAAASTDHLAYVEEELGNLDRARTLHEEAARRAHAAGNVHLEAEALGSVAELALVQGQTEQALPLLQQSTRMFSDVGDPAFIASNLSRFSRALIISERPGAAAQVLARGQATLDEFGLRWFHSFNSMTRAMIRAQLDDDAYAEASELGKILSPEDAVALALRELGADAGREHS
jgi:predicted ATPase/class 3 adenylate cyclase